MRGYIRPRVRLVRLEPVALVASSSPDSDDSETVAFTFRTETPSIWEEGERRVME